MTMRYFDLGRSRKAAGFLLLAAALAICALSSSAAVAQTVPKFGTAQLWGGNMIVDQTTGAITVCYAATNTTNTSPYILAQGLCKDLGSISPSSTSPSLVISTPLDETTGQYSALVTNVYTGVVVQCAWRFNVGGNGMITGLCTTIATAS
jgi:hypothetical protein